MKGHTEIKCRHTEERTPSVRRSKALMAQLEEGGGEIRPPCALTPPVSNPLPRGVGSFPAVSTCRADERWMAERHEIDTQIEGASHGCAPFGSLDQHTTPHTHPHKHTHGCAMMLIGGLDKERKQIAPRRSSIPVNRTVMSRGCPCRGGRVF